jgi:plastocyanin
MVAIAPLVGAAVFLSGLAAALPTNSYDSSSNYGSSNSNSNSNYGSSDSNSNYGSSDSNSNYGSSNSNYGNSNSNYGNSGSNYGNSNNYDSSSSSNEYESSSYNNNYETSSSYNNNYETSSSYNNNYESSSSYNNNYETSSTYNNYDTTSTTSAYNSYQTSNYGSGSNYWGGSGYEDCVNQCIAQFGGSSGGGSYQATATSGSEGSTGTGVTHTVIVAPTKGTFRMVPFATNASVGDTILFQWGADGHTVTKSSELLPCNKSADNPVFASGIQNKSFVFTQVVNDTNPTFYYCGVPTHCEKGMFGIINPAQALPGAPTSLGGMMSSMAANDSDLSAYAAYSNNVTSGNNAASNWAANIDMSSLPDWSHSLVATNVLYSRAVLGMNPEVLQAGGSVDLSSVAATPLMLPMDITAPLNAATAQQAGAAPGTTGASDAGAAPVGAAATSPGDAAPATTSAPTTNGASSVASPRFLVAAVVVVATIFAL